MDAIEKNYVRELFATGHFDELLADLSSRVVTFQDIRGAVEEFVGESSEFTEYVIRVVETKVHIWIPASDYV